MGTVKFTASLLLTSLFAIAIMGYAVNFGADNNVATDTSDNVLVSGESSKIQDSVLVFKDDINSSYESFSFSTIESSDETTRTGGQFKGTVRGISDTAIHTLNVTYKTILGGDKGANSPAIFFTALSTFLILLFFLYLWKTWKGNPD